MADPKLSTNEDHTTIASIDKNRTTLDCNGVHQRSRSLPSQCPCELLQLGAKSLVCGCEQRTNGINLWKPDRASRKQRYEGEPSK